MGRIVSHMFIITFLECVIGDSQSGKSVILFADQGRWLAEITSRPFAAELMNTRLRRGEESEAWGFCSSVTWQSGQAYSGRISRSLNRTASAPSRVNETRSSSKSWARGGHSTRFPRIRLILGRSVETISSADEDISS